MVDLIDSYAEGNQDNFATIRDLHPSDVANYASEIGQSFTNGAANKKITSAKFYLLRGGSPTGNMHFVLYALSGAYGGGNDVPTGAALATSDALDVTTISNAAYTLYELTFTGAEQYTMVAGTAYCISCQAPTSGTCDNTNYIRVGLDASAPSHTGNLYQYANGAYAAGAAYDTCFYVYGETPPTTAPKGTGLQNTMAMMLNSKMLYG